MQNEYNIEEILSTIRKCHDIDSAVFVLDESYEKIISYYCGKISSDKSKQLLLLKDNVHPRYWNCVNIHNNIKNHILWMSINPSGAVEDEEGNYIQETKNCKFNFDWDPQIKDNYWKTLISKIGSSLLGDCGHLDMLPIHLTTEQNVYRTFFKDTSSQEFKLVVDLVRCTQALLELIQPKLIIYSNVTTKWLWGINNAGWMGYKLEPVEEYYKNCSVATKLINDLRSSIKGYWHKNPNKGLFRIVGINENNFSHNRDTKLNSYILIDYQVANYTWNSSSLQPGDISKVLNTLNYFK